MSNTSCAPKAAERIATHIKNWHGDVSCDWGWRYLLAEITGIIDEEAMKEMDSLNYQLMDYQSRPDYDNGYIDGSNAAAQVLKKRYEEREAKLTAALELAIQDAHEREDFILETTLAKAITGDKSCNTESSNNAANTYPNARNGSFGLI